MRALPTLLSIFVLLAPGPGFAQDAAAPSPDDLGAVRACLESAGDADGARACVGTRSGPCMDTEEGGMTLGVAECLGNEETAWDAILNERDEAAVADAKRKDSDLGDEYVKDIFTSLRDAQRAWIAYRDAECGRRYAYWKDGSIRTVEAATCQLQLTAERAIDLAPEDR